MALTIYVNTDTQDFPLGTSGVEFTEFSQENDRLIFSGGSTEVDDGEDLPTDSELISAGVQITGSQIIVDRYFLEDISDTELKEIFNMGNQDKRYTLAFEFDAETASEPVLEVYDDDNLNTITSTFLGGGTPSSSFLRGITTTSGSPGSNWISGATRMAGSGSGNFLYLNDQNGALTGASNLYCNLAVVVPASQTAGLSAEPVLVVKWLSN